MASTSSEFPHNNYATKKTITQGMLDLALLTSNAAQLKQLLDVGTTYPYYALMMTLVCVSIILQVLRGCVNLILGSLYNIADESQQKTATVLNNVVLVLGVLTGIVNSITSAFDISTSKGI